MKRSWKRTRIWRRLVSGLLTAVMLVTMLPTAAYAALLDNTPDQNRQILEELTAFWGMKRPHRRPWSCCGSTADR